MKQVGRLTAVDESWWPLAVGEAGRRQTNAVKAVGGGQTGGSQLPKSCSTERWPLAVDEAGRRQTDSGG